MSATAASSCFEKICWNRRYFFPNSLAFATSGPSVPGMADACEPGVFKLAAASVTANNFLRASAPSREPNLFRHSPHQDQKEV